MKNKLVVQRTKNNSYQWTECTNIQMCVLEHFLSEYQLDDVPFFLSWTSKQKCPMGFGNLSTLEIKNNIVLIGQVYSNREDNGPLAKLRISEFIKLIEEWEKLVKAQANIIVITLQNGNVFIYDGSNELHPIPSGLSYLFKQVEFSQELS